MRDHCGISLFLQQALISWKQKIKHLLFFRAIEPLVTVYLYFSEVALSPSFIFSQPNALSLMILCY